MKALLLAATLVFALASCTDDPYAPAEGSTNTSTPTTAQVDATTTTSPPTTSPPTANPPTTAMSDDGSDALAFYRSTEAACIAHADQYGNPRPEPSQFADAVVVEQRDDDTWVVADGNGQELVVDLDAGVVFSTDGPDGILPPEYSFGCPPDLYLGGLAS